MPENPNVTNEDIYKALTELFNYHANALTNIEMTLCTIGDKLIELDKRITSLSQDTPVDAGTYMGDKKVGVNDKKVIQLKIVRESNENPNKE
jgi:hypothetical protein